MKSPKTVCLQKEILRIVKHIKFLLGEEIWQNTKINITKTKIKGHLKMNITIDYSDNNYNWLYKKHTEHNWPYKSFMTTSLLGPNSQDIMV